jgi:4-oxalocrotonate tautomerase
MPLINVKAIEGVFTPEQKAEILHKLTEAMVSVEGEALRGVTWAVFEEVASGSWAIGGEPLTTGAVQSLQQQPAAVAG